jgi:DNA-binding IclR family transcriptional regulator
MLAGRTPPVPSLDRALSVLEMLAASRAGLSLGELVQRLHLPKSSTHCLMVTLERRGYLARNPKTGRYLFGLKLFEVANMALGAVRLRQQASPLLQSLAQKTGLTAHLGILEQGEIVLLERFVPTGRVNTANTWVGMRMGVHGTGMGKALMAHMTEAEFNRLFSGHPPPHYNENTITSLKELKKEAACIRSLGYAYEDEEGEIGFRCIGAPVFDEKGNAIAAVSVAGTTSQITPENRHDLAEQVMGTAGRISHNLRIHRPQNEPRGGDGWKDPTDDDT